MALSDYTFQFRNLVFGKGRNVRVRSLTGFDDYTVRDADKLIPQGDGAIPSVDFVNPKDIDLELEVIGSEAVVEQVIREFNRRDTIDQLIFKEPNRPEVFVYARPLARARILDANSKFLHIIRIRLRATDPRIYGIDQFQEQVSIYDPSGGGLDYGIGEYGKEYPVPAGLETIIQNEGDSYAYPTIRVFGPQDGGTCTGILVENTTNDDELEVNTTILSDQILTVDMRAFVTANGERVVDLSGSNQFGAWATPRTPFRLDPGENHIRFHVTGTSLNVPMFIVWRNTSL